MRPHKLYLPIIKTKIKNLGIHSSEVSFCSLLDYVSVQSDMGVVMSLSNILPLIFTLDVISTLKKEVSCPCEPQHGHKRKYR